LHRRENKEPVEKNEMYFHEVTLAKTWLAENLHVPVTPLPDVYG